MGKLFVTGATGGVGIISLMLLSKLGYEVSAITGKQESEQMLKNYGAKEIMMRDQFDEPLKSPLQKSIFIGGVDAVGGQVLSNLLTLTGQRAAVACCGMVNGAELNTSIFPFILRGVTLFGVDSAETEIEVKKEIWNNFATTWKLKNLEDEIKDCLLYTSPSPRD